MLTSYYEVYAQLSALQEMERITDGYRKFIQTGNSGMSDYNTGYIHVCIYHILNNDGNCVRIFFGTIDDAAYGCWCECKTKEKAVKIVEDIANVFRNMVSLPSLDEINVLLRNFNCYIVQEN